MIDTFVYSGAAVSLVYCDKIGAVSTSKRAVRLSFLFYTCLSFTFSEYVASPGGKFSVPKMLSQFFISILQLKSQKIPESEYTTLPNGLK